MMTDPIADMLTRLRNANIAFHDDVIMPSSKVKEALAKILVSEGYIEGFSIDDDPGRPGRKLRIVLKYTPDRRSVISGMKRISRPGQRNYRGATEIKPVVGGLGISILTTPKGLMTGRAARKANVGGELLCEVW